MIVVTLLSDCVIAALFYLFYYTVTLFILKLIAVISFKLNEIRNIIELIIQKEQFIVVQIYLVNVENGTLNGSL